MARMTGEKIGMKCDTKKIDEATLALLYLVSWKEGLGVRAWKSFDWDTMNRLHEKGWISDPKSKNEIGGVDRKRLSRITRAFPAVLRSR